MSCGNLSATPPTAESLEFPRQRELGLRGIPPARELRRHRAAAVDLHPEAIEAERLRPIDAGIVLLAAAEPVARFARLARRAHPHAPSRPSRTVHPSRFVERQLHRLSPSSR